MPAVWTIEQRQAAAARARLQRPWDYSTGPRTALGKHIASQNSYKHGRYTFGRKVLGWYIRLAALRVKQAKAGWMRHEQNFKNELSAMGFNYGVKQPRTMAFYPYYTVHPLTEYDKFFKNPKKPDKKLPLKEIYAFFDGLKEE